MKNSYVVLFLIFIFTSVQAQKNKFNLLIGTYTNSCESKGIYTYDFDTNTGGFNLKSATENIVNPSYLTVSKNNNYVYSVNENGPESTVSSFGYNPSSGKLSLINKQSSKGADPCCIINDDKNVIVANYSGGNIAVFGKNSDGSIAEAKQVVQHYGKGVNAQRQEGPHVHMVHFSPDRKFILSNDLGNDKVYSYQYNPNAATEILKIKDSVAVKSGSGPRHLTFSNDGKFVYLLQELDGALTVFSYSNGILKKIDETTILAKDFKGTFSSADIHISPDGKFLYATNRGEANTISIFKILKNGKLQSKGQRSTLGKGPRNFAIDPTGKFLLVAHQYTNDVVIFKRNATTGVLTDTGKRIALCSPVCLVFTKN
ncbi:lactonase family protein [Flavobacterium gawalongense]|uniref:Lactonase family protein n=1 Tax=Flavobacterium gawalongense TaxID=2594432 RepID=A0A553BR46_9FLAO|nr:lactonase family protein [Flavobacterium gawalongense]TRX10734.1 lactonase family protein [Flavobacterium gawalongense]TRX11457.1 lactonase family protein [Flavobacterium gawalongense]TRX29226.1 lactonase family protein [Flavobacterium gawalongense]